MEIFLQIVLPIIIISAFAAIFAFCLSYLGDRMAVERDPKIDEIEKKLSGANCGGCGYAGCSQFAEALFKGEADISRCNPTPIANKKAIAAILGVDADAGERTVAVVHCIGGNRAENKYEYHGYGDCTAAQMLAGGSKVCANGCLGLGTCVQACASSAVGINKDIAVSEVRTSDCTSCGKCIAACPKGIIGRIPASAAVYVACSNTGKGKEVMTACKFGCIACGKCARVCAQNAIAIENNLPKIDYKKCVGCMECSKQCPRKCIVARK